MALRSAAYRPTARPFSSIKRQHKVAWHGRWWADSHWQIGSPWCGPWGVGGLAASASSWVGSAGVFEIASHTVAITDCQRCRWALLHVSGKGHLTSPGTSLGTLSKATRRQYLCGQGQGLAPQPSPALPSPAGQNQPMQCGQPPKARPSSPCSSCFPFAHSRPHPRGD